MTRCLGKKKAKIPRKTIKGKSYPNYGPPSTSSDTRTAKEKFDANPARKAMVERKRRKKRRSKVSDNDTTTTTTTTTSTDTDTNTDTDTVTSNTDLTTTSGGIIGGTSVTPESIYTRDPEDAISDQEKLAQEELKRQRIKRARTKQSLLRKRLERTQEVGSGRRVLSGSERELNVQTRQAGTGRRGGAGRRSLITGSTGGIGYYSRFL